MRSLRHTLVLAAVLATPALAVSHRDAAAALHAVAPAPVDPVGTYDWSLEAQGSAFSGTLTIAKQNDSTFTATVTHAQNGQEVKAKYVKLDGDHLVVVSDTEYGDLTMDLKFAASAVEGSWKVGDGSYGGPLQVSKKKP